MMPNKTTNDPPVKEDPPKLTPEALVAAVREEIADCEAKIAENQERIEEFRKYIRNGRARIAELKLMLPRKKRAKKAKA